MAPGFSPSPHTRNKGERGGTVMSDYEMFSQFMMVLSMVIAAVTIGYTIGKKK